MGVYIKRMEMPKGCAACPYCDRAWNKPKCKAKGVQGRFMGQRLNLDRTRQTWCPLVPVPQHGRLIDADAFKKRCIDGLESFKEEFTSQRGLELAFMVYDDFFACIDAQPTVIPAEQEDKKE